MALIKCPECSYEVSDKAISCPNCAFPIAEYLQDEQFNAEVTKLQEKIKSITFTTPAPHAKICIKCGKAWAFPENEPKCKCSFCNHQYPAIEIDYPAIGIYAGRLDVLLYIQNHYIEPLNIGDKDSAEYKSRLESFYARIHECEEFRKTHGAINWEIKEKTPKEFVKEYNLDTHPEEGYCKKSDCVYNAPAPSIPTPAPNIPKCPICGSTNLSEITNWQKAGKAFLFGLFATSEMSKKWKCNNCGAKF